MEKVINKNSIFCNRNMPQETNTKSKISTLQFTGELIQKYTNHPKCLNGDNNLPILTKQKMNTYLKEIGDLYDISKEITFQMVCPEPYFEPF